MIEIKNGLIRNNFVRSIKITKYKGKLLAKATTKHLKTNKIILCGKIIFGFGELENLTKKSNEWISFNEEHFY